MNMSEAKNNSRSKQVGPTVPKGHVLGEFTNYQEATAMVDRLLQGDFKATDVSIVGHDPVLVERIRSRLGYGRVAASGALTGFWIGLIFALLIGAGVTVMPDGGISYNPQEFAAVLVISSGFGMLFNIVRFSFTKNRRAFVSSQQPVATRYQVIVPEAQAGLAHKALTSNS